MSGGSLVALFASIVAPIYKIILVAAAVLIPIIIVRILVARSTTNAEELAESRELTKAGINIALIFVLLPPIATILIMIISKAFSGSTVNLGAGGDMTVTALQGTGTSAVYSLIFGVLTWLAIAFASMARTTFTYSLVPAIGTMEETTFFQASGGGVGNAINSFWIFFMGLAVAIILILVLVDYFKDVFALASGESVSRPALGGGIFTMLARVITSVLMAAFSWPISRAIIFLGEQLYNIFIKVLGTPTDPTKGVYGTIAFSDQTAAIDSSVQMKYLASFINNTHPIAAGSAIYALSPWSDKMASVISGATATSGYNAQVGTIFSIASLPQALVILFISTYSTMMIVTITAMMAMRYIMLAFLVVVSPIVFSGLASKFTEKGFEKWLNKMITWSVFPVIVAMILLFGYFLASGMGGAFGASTRGTLDPATQVVADRSVYFIKMFIYAAAMMLVTKAPSLISELTSGLTEGMEEPNAIISSLTKRK
jgi:hypothetical protein